ncbi:9877_t:CDS:2 [Entrophospora sp. SA101]|nr:9877_t:CDS:2 [Entrophospora sp. SA101]CAJ0911953.1 11848_t:CDS:2 [Entrophospora sp. SA101]
MYSKIIKDRVEKRKNIIPEMKLFGAHSFKLNVFLYFLDFVGHYQLVEIDNVSLPRDMSEIKDFVNFYGAIIKWALLTSEFKLKSSDPESRICSSRLSYSFSHFISYGFIIDFGRNIGSACEIKPFSSRNWDAIGDVRNYNAIRWW